MARLTDSTRKRYLSHKSDLKIYGQRRLLENVMLTNLVCARQICIPKVAIGPQLPEILPSAPQAALLSTSLIAISFLFSSLSSKCPDSLYCLTRQRKSETRSFRENRNTAYQQRILSTKMRHRVQRLVQRVILLFPKSPFPDMTTFRGTGKSFLSSASLWFLKYHPRSEPQTPSHLLCCGLQSLHHSIPFHFSFRGADQEARMVVKGTIFPFQRIREKEFPDSAEYRSSGPSQHNARPKLQISIPPTKTSY